METKDILQAADIVKFIKFLHVNCVVYQHINQ